jgi:FkbM family methyltransferase
MKIFEIGVGEYFQCRTTQYIGTEHECWLFEPNPESFAQIQSKLGEKRNFKLFNCAIGKENGFGDLIILKGSSYVEGTHSPALSYDNEKFSFKNNKTVKIEIKNIREFDKGDIDILLLDMEGGEYNVINEMISRPKIIVIEMYSFGAKYTNPNYDNIIKWMEENKYNITSRHEDYVFERL